MLYENTRRDHPAHFINIRTCSTTSCFVIKKRLKSGGRWEDCERVAIDPSVMIAGGNLGAVGGSDPAAMVI